VPYVPRGQHPRPPPRGRPLHRKLGANEFEPATDAHAAVSLRRSLASFGSTTAWLNSEPLTADALKGHVVLVDFWTYTRIYWLRTLPYIRAWAGKYENQGAGHGRRAHARILI
jgi:hypothetical protein